MAHNPMKELSKLTPEQIERLTEHCLADAEAFEVLKVTIEGNEARVSVRFDNGATRDVVV